jgi:hypothetical protein
MSFPLQVVTQNKVLAAQVRGVLNAGPEWGTVGSTVAAINDTTANSLSAITGATGTASATSAISDATYSAAANATIVAKVNKILAVLRNLNLPSDL